MPSKFTPDPRTFVVLQKLMDSQPPGVSDDAVIEAFYSYFDTTLKNCSVGNISKQWLENMKKSVPLNLQYAHPQMMEDLLNEIDAEYIECGKVSAVDYILKKPKGEKTKT